MSCPKNVKIIKNHQLYVSTDILVINKIGHLFKCSFKFHKKILNQWKYTKVEEIIIKEDPL